MEKWKLAEVTDLPFHQDSRAWSIYHSITPELRQWWAAEEKSFRASREIYNGMGRRFKVIQRLDDDVLDSIIAFYPQSTIGDKVTRVSYMCQEAGEWPERRSPGSATDVPANT